MLQLVRGATSVDLPVASATTLQLLLDLRGAEAPRLADPAPVLARAEEVGA
ncbi:MAG: hypothetical protein JWR86_85 [Enterovirga sp.]|jgi:hypothetical protein|nr:hypothetical protein [Enterovirga sp.]